MKLKDALIGLLMWLGILGFIAVISSIDGWPLWALIVLAVIVWIVYILVIIRDYRRDLKYPVVRVRQEDTVRRDPHPIYDQEEDKR